MAACFVCGNSMGVSSPSQSLLSQLVRSKASVADFLWKNQVLGDKKIPGEEELRVTEQFLCLMCHRLVVNCDEFYQAFLEGLDALKERAINNDIEKIEVVQEPVVDGAAEVQETTSLEVPTDVEDPLLEPTVDFDDLPDTPMAPSPPSPASPETNPVDVAPEPDPLSPAPPPTRMATRSKPGPSIQAPTTKRRRRRSSKPTVEKKKDKSSILSGKMCGYCFFKLTRARGCYAEHLKAEHPGKPRRKTRLVEELKCGLCPFTTRIKDVLTAHEGFIHGFGKRVPRFPCPDCGEVFRFQSGVHKHRTIAHGAPKAYSCNICGHKVNSPVGLKNHMQTKHHSNMGPKRICDQCGEEVLIELLALHNKKHYVLPPKKDFPCEHCDKKVFRSKTDLLNHLTRKHGIGDYVRTKFKDTCPECKLVMKTRESFYAHVLRNHGIELPGLRRYPCQDCDKVFYVKRMFENHAMSHSGQNKYLCPDCDFSTMHSGSFYRHRRRKHNYRGPEGGGSESPENAD